MRKAPLAGRSILIVEDEPLIALDIAEGFRSAGASVLSAHNLQDGLRLAGHPDLSAAVLDFGLRDGEGTALCARLKDRRIPFVLHTGYQHTSEACHAGVLVPKPTAQAELVSTVARLLASEEASPRHSRSRNGKARLTPPPRICSARSLMKSGRRRTEAR